jgi:single-strand DNA-binding protein
MTRDIELKTGNSGNTFGKFSIAVNNGKTKDGENDTLFLDCTAFGKTSEIIGKYFQKGDGIILHGALKTEKWEKDGAKHSKNVLTVSGIDFPLSKKQPENNAPAQEDDLPEWMK